MLAPRDLQEVASVGVPISMLATVPLASQDTMKPLETRQPPARVIPQASAVPTTPLIAVVPLAAVTPAVVPVAPATPLVPAVSPAPVVASVVPASPAVPSVEFIMVNGVKFVPSANTSLRQARRLQAVVPIIVQEVAVPSVPATASVPAAVVAATATAPAVPAAPVPTAPDTTSAAANPLSGRPAGSQVESASVVLTPGSSATVVFTLPAVVPGAPVQTGPPVTLTGNFLQPPHKHNTLTGTSAMIMYTK